jgi:hypothetical protein
VNLAAKHRRYLILIAICFLAAFVFFRLKELLTNHLDQIKTEYQMSLELSQNKEEKSALFKRFLAERRMPAAKLLDSSEWIKRVQGLVSSEEVLLQELRPIRGLKRAGEPGESLYLSVEGQMISILNLFYRISTANDLIYIREFTLSSNREDADTVRAQMTLAQY